MIVILEYVKEHSTLILVVLGLILFAIIGYYADKTNFGQGKKSDKDNSEQPPNKPIEDLSNVKLNEVIPSSDLVNNVKEIPSQEVLQVDDAISLQENVPQTLEPVQSTVTSLNETLPNSAPVSNEPVQMTVTNQPNEEVKESILTEEVPKVKPNKKIKTKEEESFNRFQEEFEMVLPKKNVISGDLLSDIDELELGKTQKIDLSEVPDIDDIELPRIKKLVNEEQDIWKF